MNYSTNLSTFRKQKQGKKQRAKNNSEPKPEIEFQYAETYLKELETCENGLDDGEGVGGENVSVEKEKCQDYLTYQPNNFTFISSNYSRNIGYNQV